MIDPYRRLRILVFVTVLLALITLAAIAALWVWNHYSPLFDMVPIGTNPNWGGV
jgi:hypothetical protein